MVVPKISLMIYGTQRNEAGWEPLIMLNNPPFPELANLGIAGLGDNPCYYTFRIDRNYTQYILAYNPRYIKASGATRDGALKIAISIPKGYTLDNGVSPSNILTELQLVLRQHALDPIVGRPDAFKFKDTFPPKEIFSRVLDSFKLVETKMPHRPMSSTSDQVGLILADDALTDALFRDVQYPEFAPYKEIAVAPLGDSQNIIRNLQIPRQPRYEIVVDGIPMTNQIGSYNYGYNDAIILDVVALKGLPRKAYEDEIIEFTVNEALSGKYSEIIGVDREREIINVSLPAPKMRRVNCNIILKGCNKPDVFDYLRATVNGKDRPISASNTIEIIGEELLGNAIINVLTDDRKYKINGNISIDGRNIYVPIMEKPRNRDQYETTERYKSKIDDSYSGKQRGLIEFKIILEDADDIENYDRLYKIRFYNDEYSLSVKSCFNKTNKNAVSNIITMPVAWEGRYNISLRTDTVKTVKPEVKTYEISPRTKEIIIKETETERLKWTDKLSKSTKRLLRIIGFILVMAIVAGVSIYGYHYYYTNRSDSKTEQTNQSDIVTESGNTSAQGEDYSDQRKQKIDTYLSQLKEDGVLFSDIKDMDSWIKGNLSYLDNNNGIELKNKVEAYLRVIEYVESPNKRKVGDIKTVANNEKDYLEKVHYDLLQKVWVKEMNSNGNPVFINNPEEKQVNNRLKEDKEYTSFLDIPASKDVLSATAGNGHGNQGKHDKKSNNEPKDDTQKPKEGGGDDEADWGN